MGNKYYDVFINHRGPDVKSGFVAHLAEALREKKIIPFVDKEDLVEGNDAFVAMKSALEAAPVLLAIFSPGYAESEHCLNELVDMLECRRKSTNVVLVPVFYDVEPQHLGWLDKGPFKEAFEKHEKRDRPDVQNWKDALNEARKTTGFRKHDYGNENELKRNVIARIEKILNHRMRPEEFIPEHFGLQTPFHSIDEALRRMEDKVAIVGIGGMGGIGKTTLAKKLYNHYSREYDSSSFLKIAGTKNLIALQKQALDDLVKVKDENAAQNYNYYFQMRFDGHCILLVIDDIMNEEHFFQLLPDIEKLAARSRVIVTSRDLGILKSITKNRQTSSYLLEMQVLEAADSYDLFCFHAFEEKDIPLKKDNAFYPLAQKVANICGGLPLALEVIGKHLYAKPDTRVWDEVVEILKTSDDILDKLSISYHALPTHRDKMMFLDICCQMAGVLRDDAIDIWESCKPCYDPRVLLRKVSTIH